MLLNKLKITIGCLMAVLLFQPLWRPSLSLAQTGAGGQTQEATASLSKQETAELQKELEAIQAEIDQYEKELLQVKSEKNTLTKKISALKLQQSKITLQIKQTNLNLQSLEVQLGVVQNDIQARQLKISQTQTQMAELIRRLNKKDRYFLLEILANSKSLSDYFSQLSAYRQITESLGVMVQEVISEAAVLAEDEVKLSDQREDQQNFIAIANLQNHQLSQTLAERNNILNQTKNKESNYQALLSDKQTKVNEIKSRLYDLLGVSKAVTFGEAVTIAQWARSFTGVRTAFLLAILTQESNLGKNVGTCNRPGDPPAKSWKVIMKPDRDQEPFKQITAELGMDPEITPVSCPMKDKNGKQLGWGGAMGPAQFIPSTWLGYRAKVSAITGKTANPWDIRDAFLAAAILLKANGAGSEAGEWAAAMKYFSGSTNARYRFYADNVLATADKYEQDIKDLNIE